MTWLLRDGDDQQRRHRDVVSEMNQRFGQRPRQVARVADDPSGYDDCKYRQDEVSDPHREVSVLGFAGNGIIRAASFYVLSILNTCGLSSARLPWGAHDREPAL